MREVIKNAALRMFDKYGYFRTGIRDVAREAGCSLPTLYYYYKNKELLFETVVCEAYESLCLQIDDQIPDGMSLQDTYYFTVMQMRMLTEDEQRVFRLAFKLRMGLDGNEAAAKRMLGWENTRRHSQEQRIGKEARSAEFARLLMRVTSNMLEQAILYDAELDDDDIRREFELLFKLEV